jgi:hypothetical protein
LQQRLVRLTGVAPPFMISKPITSACASCGRCAIASSAAQIAAEPVAQAFSSAPPACGATRASATATSEALKSCGTKPALKWPTKMPSMSGGSSPALRGGLHRVADQLLAVQPRRACRRACGPSR